jgi:hypothetical protein
MSSGMVCLTNFIRNSIGIIEGISLPIKFKEWHSIQKVPACLPVAIQM